jgi:hypothetical protein
MHTYYLVRCIPYIKSMINFTQEAPKNDPWVRIGSGFSTKKGNGFNITIGNQVPKERGSKELVETVDSITLKPGDELYLGEATGKDGRVVTTKNGATVYRLQLKPARVEASETASA